MKKGSVLPLALGLALFLSTVGNAAAQGKTVTVPKGTKVEKLGPGSFKLTTPDGIVLAITSYKKTGKALGAPGTAGILGDCGIIGDCGIRDAKGKVVATGSNGLLRSAVKPLAGGAAAATKDVPPGDYIKIDDEITWLPATIQFPSLRVFDRQALGKLSPQPDPPGAIR